VTKATTFVCSATVTTAAAATAAAAAAARGKHSIDAVTVDITSVDNDVTVASLNDDVLLHTFSFLGRYERVFLDLIVLTSFRCV
jgi:hypothetical protein